MTSDLRALPSGTRLSDYKLERVLGHGGFGITYLAVDLSLDQKVAIKEYYPREFAVRDSTKTIHAAGNAEDKDNFSWGLERFREEAKTLARFSHPNVVAIRRLFEANGTSYIVMEFCEGEPLDKLIKREAPLSKGKLEAIFASLMDGLEHVHAAGVMHRDIKPANIFIRADGSPVLLDFGAARQALVSHSRSMTSLATAHYAAFEQYSTHGKQGAWTDIYGLSATLYHAATGEKPQDAPDRILEDTLEPLAERAAGQYSENVLKAIDAGLAVRPEDRPQSIKKWRQYIKDSKPALPVARERVRKATNEHLTNTHGRTESTFRIGVLGLAAAVILIVGPLLLAGQGAVGDFETALRNEANGSEEINFGKDEVDISVDSARKFSGLARAAAERKTCPAPTEVWNKCSGTLQEALSGTGSIPGAYSGEWMEDSYDGVGVFTYTNFGRYEGQFRRNKRHGYGIFYYKDGKKIYEGQWADDTRHGWGRALDGLGQEIERGEFKEGVLVKSDPQ